MHSDSGERLSTRSSSPRAMACLLAALLAVAGCESDPMGEDADSGNQIADSGTDGSEGDGGNGAGDGGDRSDGGDGGESGDGDGGDPDDGGVDDGGVDGGDGGASDDGGGIDGGDVGGGDVDGGNADLDGGDAEVECPAPDEFDYTCSTNDTSTCPSGLCIFGLCVAPVVDPERFDACGDGVCEACETAEGCPADCASPPIISGAKEYENDTTITV